MGRPTADGLAPGVLFHKDRRLESSDGATLHYTFLGPEDGPLVALVSGFLCPDTWWRLLVPSLVDHGYRVLVFHYRGIALSTLPPAIDSETFTIPRFALDLVEICDHEEVESVCLVSHSMGTQVMLEAFDMLRGRVPCMVSVTGPYASPIKTLWERPWLGAAIYEPVRLGAMLVAPPLLRLGWKLATTYVPGLPVARMLGVLGERSTDELVMSYVEHLATMDPHVARRVAAGMHAHSAEELLAEVDVPTLVIVGGRDPWSPPAVGHHMVDVMPSAELRVVPHGTHGTILEFPEQVNGWILDHLDRGLSKDA